MSMSFFLRLKKKLDNKYCKILSVKVHHLNKKLEAFPTRAAL